MSDLSAKFATFEEQVAAQNIDTQAALADIIAALGTLNGQIDTLNINGAVNARFLASALAALNPCQDCEGMSLVVPPTSPTDVSLTEDLCKRVHAFLHAMSEVFTVLDVMSTFGVGFSTTILTNAFNEVITALENDDPTPLPSFPEMVQIVGDGISYIASNAFVGHTLSSLYASVVLDMLKPIFNAGNAAAAQSAYNAILEGTDYSVFEVRLMEHSAWNALYSYYFDPTSTPNLAGYSGVDCYDSIAGITECTDYEATEVTLFGQSFHIVQTLPHSTIVSWGNVGDIFHFTLQVISGTPVGGVTVYSVTDGPPHEEPFFTMALGDAPRLIIGHPTDFSIRTTTGNAATPAYTVRICPPS